jgi:hypothetical protein
MDEFMTQYGSTSFGDMVASGTSGGPNSGTLVEQMRKQALENAEQDEVADWDEDQEADEWAAYAAMQEAEDQEIHDTLIGSGSRPSNWTADQKVEEAEDDLEAEAKARALSLYRAAESAIREAAMEGGGTDAPTRMAYYASENHLAKEQSIKWRDRGPRGPNQPATFKGQKWRATTQRYSSRGGWRQAEFAALYSGKNAKKGGGKQGGKGGKHGSKEGGSKSKGGKQGSKSDGSQA